MVINGRTVGSWVLAIVALSACSSTDGPPMTIQEMPPLVCRSAVTLGDGPYFTDITAQIFQNTPPLGLYLTTVDLDGDGYPDLITHHNSDRPDLTTDPPTTTWRVFHNVAGPDGQRVFVDETVESGYGAARDGTNNRAAGGAIVGDFDNDGNLDLISGVGAPANQPDTGDRTDLFLGDGAGHLTRVTTGDLARTTPVPWSTTAYAPIDFDRDGNLDLYEGFWYADASTSSIAQQARLYRGNGDGTFTEVTTSAGLTTTATGFAQGTNHRPLYGVTSCDLDDDGWPELLGSAYGRQWNQLWHNEQGHFRELGRPTKFAADDNLTYSDNEFYRCYCQGNPTACSPMPPAPVISCPTTGGWDPGVDDQPWRLGGNTFTTACGDADNDGDLDLFNAEIRHWWAGQSADPSQLLVSRPDSTTGAGVIFDRPGLAATGFNYPHSGMAWDEGGIVVSFLDFDLDGNQDVYLGFSDYPGDFGMLFRGNGDGTFTDISMQAGLHHPCVKGMSFVDIDGDGDQDVIVGTSTFRDCAATSGITQDEVRVFRNDVGQDGNFLRLRLVGSGTGGANRAAIGARVRVTIMTASGREILRRDVQGGYGVNVVPELWLTIGTADACTADVEVRWPDAAGTIETYTGVRANYRTVITQGKGIHYLADGEKPSQ